MIVLAATINPDLSSVTGSKFGQPMAQIYYDAVGKNGTLGLMSLLFIVQFMMGLSILVAASRQTWAFSRDGALPFSGFFRPISQRFGYIPLRTIWGCVGLAAVLGLLCLIAPAAAQALFSLAVAGNNFAWGVPIFARVVWGQQKFKPGPFYTGDRFSIPIAWSAIAFLLLGIFLSMFPVGGPNPDREFCPHDRTQVSIFLHHPRLTTLRSILDELHRRHQLRNLDRSTGLLLRRCTEMVHGPQGNHRRGRPHRRAAERHHYGWDGHQGP